MNLNISIKHSTNLDFFDLELTKQKQRFVSGLYQHIMQTLRKIYQANDVTLQGSKAIFAIDNFLVNL